MRGGWNYDSSFARPTSPSMSPHSPLPDGQYQQHNVHPSQSYHASYIVASPQRGGVSTLDAMSSYLPQFPWQSDSAQNASGNFPDSPTGTSYSENGAFDNNYYLGQHSNQSLGYPESSQRTHAHVPDSSYSAIYPRFDGSGISGQLQGTSHDVGGMPGLYHSQRHFIAGQGGELTAQGAYSMRGDAPSTQPELRQVPPQRGMGSTRTGVLPQLGGYPAQTSLPAMLHGVPVMGNVHPSSRSNQHHISKPSPPQYPYQQHTSSIHKFGEPGNTSVVPPLIFDGDAGEELDDDSECSLPSASSDASRSGDPQYSPPGVMTRDEWNAASMDDATSFEMGSPSSEHIAFGARSPTLSPEPGLSSPTLGSTSEHSKSKKSKMHQCAICSKWFPRPSGLATHMNSHSGARRTSPSVVYEELLNLLLHS